MAARLAVPRPRADVPCGAQVGGEAAAQAPGAGAEAGGAAAAAAADKPAAGDVEMTAAKVRAQAPVAGCHPGQAVHSWVPMGTIISLSRVTSSGTCEPSGCGFLLALPLCVSLSRSSSLMRRPAARLSQ